MNRKLLLLAILIIPFLNACQPEQTDLPEGVWISFRNETSEDINDAVMHFYSLPSVRIGSIKRGQSTSFLYFNAVPVISGEYSPAPGDVEGSLGAVVDGQQTEYSGQLVYDTSGVRFALADGRYVLRIREKSETGYLARWLEFE